MTTERITFVFHENILQSIEINIVGSQWKHDVRVENGNEIFNNALMKVVALLLRWMFLHDIKFS